MNNAATGVMSSSPSCSSSLAVTMRKSMVHSWYSRGLVLAAAPCWVQQSHSFDMVLRVYADDPANSWFYSIMRHMPAGTTFVTFVCFHRLDGLSACAISANSVTGTLFSWSSLQRTPCHYNILHRRGACPYSARQLLA